jgi:hypothetical protein
MKHMPNKLQEEVGHAHATHATRAEDSPLARLLVLTAPVDAAASATQPTAIDPYVAVLTARIGMLRQHIAQRATDPRWRDLWVSRLDDPDGWRYPMRIATAMLEDYLDPAVAGGDMAAFDWYEPFIRDFILEAPEFEQRALRPEHRHPEFQRDRL